MFQIIATKLNLPAHQVKNVVNLLEGNATIPFIARYRKEATGNKSFLIRFSLSGKTEIYFSTIDATIKIDN